MKGMNDSRANSKIFRLPRHNQRGNVLWYILVTLGLLGLLTAVISRLSSNVEQSANRESSSITNSQIMRYGSGIEAAIQNMKFQDVSENDISFYNFVSAADYTNSDCDDSSDSSYPTCLVFDAKGAGLTFQLPPSGFNDGSEWIFTGKNTVPGIGNDATPDLVMILPNVDQANCLGYNDELGVTNPSGDAPEDSDGIDTTPFTGTFSASAQIGHQATIGGQKTACIKVGSSYYIYYALLAR